ncbi:MAG: type II toxin-antitoxin system PemK/MazF family toxin [Candidatus Riflebacteria bacterium]|nr:type II toxin-antitoxin system PemK/MazF family toxin [Candidatus Riflebacteria bacterium]
MAYFIPDRGDVIWLDFNPSLGHEQAGRRPAIVLSSFKYNQKVGLAVVCPITSQVKGYPFEIQIPQGFKIQGVILSDQLKSIDLSERNVEMIFKIPIPVVEEVQKFAISVLTK